VRGAEPAGGEGSKVKERAPPDRIKSRAGTPRSELGWAVGESLESRVGRRESESGDEREEGASESRLAVGGQLVGESGDGRGKSGALLGPGPTKPPLQQLPH